MIEVNNLTGRRLDKKFVEKVCRTVFKKEKNGLSIAFVGSGEIRKLNRKYRKKDNPTDVLSFGDEKDLAEVVICPKEVEKNAKTAKVPFKEELTRVLIHGLLHVLSFDHEKGGKKAGIMEKKQEKYLFEILK